MIENNAYGRRITALMKKVKIGYMSATGQSKRKIFCIGFNKTGTSSLHRFFEDLGLTSTHNVFWPAHSRAWKCDKSLFRYQCYSDGEKADFIALDGAFPGSLFILNNRNERDWLYSRLKHVLRFNEDIDASTILTDSRFGWMARDFFSNKELAIKKWISERRIYVTQAIRYFNGRSDFIEVDITTSPQWPSELLDFLKSNSYPVNELASNHGSTYHKNKRDTDVIHDQSLLARCKELVDDILLEIDHSR